MEAETETALQELHNFLSFCYNTKELPPMSAPLLTQNVFFSDRFSKLCSPFEAPVWGGMFCHYLEKEAKSLFQCGLLLTKLSKDQNWKKSKQNWLHQMRIFQILIQFLFQLKEKNMEKPYMKWIVGNKFFCLNLCRLFFSSYYIVVRLIEVIKELDSLEKQLKDRRLLFLTSQQFHMKQMIRFIANILDININKQQQQQKKPCPELHLEDLVNFWATSIQGQEQKQQKQQTNVFSSENIQYIKELTLGNEQELTIGMPSKLYMKVFVISFKKNLFYPLLTSKEEMLSASNFFLKSQLAFPKSGYGYLEAKFLPLVHFTPKFYPKVDTLIKVCFQEGRGKKTEKEEGKVKKDSEKEKQREEEEVAKNSEKEKQQEEEVESDGEKDVSAKRARTSKETQ